MSRDHKIEFPGLNGVTFEIAAGGNLEIHLHADPAWRRGVVEHVHLPELLEFLAGRNGRADSRAKRDPEDPPADA